LVNVLTPSRYNDQALADNEHIFTSPRDILFFRMWLGMPADLSFQGDSRDEEEAAQQEEETMALLDGSRRLGRQRVSERKIIVVVK
jgi:hypothetical protein